MILDWVPGGFCANSEGLATFNGEMLYEHKIHPNWNTHQFDYARGEVRSFLVSNALFWAERFHADGIRMDGVSSMLYMNFGIDDPGQKRFNEKAPRRISTPPRSSARPMPRWASSIPTS